MDLQVRLRPLIFAFHGPEVSKMNITLSNKAFARDNGFPSLSKGVGGGVFGVSADLRFNISTVDLVGVVKMHDRFLRISTLDLIGSSASRMSSVEFKSKSGCHFGPLTSKLQLRPFSNRNAYH